MVSVPMYPAIRLVTTAVLQSSAWAANEPLGSGEMRWLFRDTAHWASLTELDLEGSSIGDDGLDELLRSDHLPHLAILDLSGNEVSDDGVKRLVASPLWPRLRALVLGANPISDEGADALADAPPTALDYLNMKYTSMTRVGQQKLLQRKGWKVDLF